MADLKISQLSVATTPAGGELVPIVQGGTTKHVTVNSLTGLLRSGGNLGLGVTPSAWISNRRALQIGGSVVSAVSFDSTIGEAFYNSYVDNSAVFRYQNTGPSGLIDFNNRIIGGFSWNVAASGTAGNAISFTQAMSLDASGNWNVDGGAGRGRVTIENGSSFNALLSTTTLFGAYNTLRVSASDIQFYAGSSPTERARIDAAGNLGLGVTPSASWSAGFRAVQIANQGMSLSTSTSSNDTYLNNNGVYNGTNWLYQNSAAAAQYRQLNGEHRWFSAPSGTAGNVISFTQAMTLDAAGNLGVGTASPSTRLHVSGTSVVPVIVQSNQSLAFLTYKDSATTDNPGAGSSGNNMVLYTNSTERLRVKAEGSLRFVPLSAAPTTNVENGDVYYDSTTNKLRVRAAGAWVDLH